MIEFLYIFDILIYSIYPDMIESYIITSFFCLWYCPFLWRFLIFFSTPSIFSIFSIFLKSFWYLALFFDIFDLFVLSWSDWTSDIFIILLVQYLFIYQYARAVPNYHLEISMLWCYWVHYLINATYKICCAVPIPQLSNYSTCSSYFILKIPCSPYKIHP